MRLWGDLIKFTMEQTCVLRKLHNPTVGAILPSVGQISAVLVSCTTILVKLQIIVFMLSIHAIIHDAWNSVV